MTESLRIVTLGLSITSSWGNGHATTYRALLGALGALGHELLFLERDQPWYRDNRDEHQPAGCRVGLYRSLAELKTSFGPAVRGADAVIVGSYVPEGADVARWVVSTARGLKLFYDIDTPVTLANLARGDESYLGRDSVPAFDAYLSFSGGTVLSAVEQRFGARLALPLYCAVDERRHEPVDVRTRYDLGYMGTYSADRQPGLERLLLEPARRYPRGRFIVAGPCYPAECRWPPNVERNDHVSPGGHARFYCSQRFTLNLTRRDMVSMGHSPSVRLFEAAACGVPIVSDRWAGLERFFTPGSEILLADTTQDVLDILENLDESQRIAIGRRARVRVLAQHTATHRARELETYLRELRAGRLDLLARRRSADFRAGTFDSAPDSATASQISGG